MAPGASPGPRGLPPRLNLTEAVRVLCDIEKVAIAVQRRFLQQESIPESSLYLGHPSCNVSDHNSTHVLLVAGWSECGTVVQSVRAGRPGWGGGLRVGAGAVSVSIIRGRDQGRLCTPRSLTLSGGTQQRGTGQVFTRDQTVPWNQEGVLGSRPVRFWCKGPGVGFRV